MFWVKSLEEECSKLKEQQIKSPRAKENLINIQGTKRRMLQVKGNKQGRQEGRIWQGSDKDRGIPLRKSRKMIKQERE